jgi:acyl-coenzyme A synthetase/AMP-(fatty) acid ligase
MLISEALTQHATLTPYYPAIISENQLINYSDLEMQTWGLVNYLQTHGVKPGDVVGLHFSSQIIHFVTALACLRLGATQISLPINEPQIKQKRIIENYNLSSVISDFDHQLASDRQRIIVTKLLNSPAPKKQTNNISPTTNATYVIGSGTTGDPKCIPLTFSNLEKLIERDLAIRPMKPAERHLYPSRIDYYTTKRRAFGCLVAGATVVMQENKGSSLLQMCERLAIDHLSLGTAQAQRLLQSIPAVKTPRLPRLKTLYVGGAPVSERLRNRLRTQINQNLCIAYGSNEFGEACIAPADLQQRIPGVIGLPCPGVTVEIVDEHDSPCSANTVGYIRLKSNSLFSGYLNNPASTQKALKSGWYYPNDFGLITNDGALVFKGRADDLIIYQGINIYPRDIEMTLEGHPNISESAAFGIRINEDTVVPVAAVTTTTMTTEQQLLEHSQKNMGWHSPQRIFIVDELPKNTAGKILKRELAATIQEKL